MAKATKKQVLGRGLTSILKDSKNKASTISKIKTNYSTEIEISKIILNPFQPRSAFNKEKLEELILSLFEIPFDDIIFSHISLFGSMWGKLEFRSEFLSISK